MNLRNKVYQMFVLAPEKDVLEKSANLCSALKDGLGGVILFTKNIQTIEQTKKLCSDIKSEACIPVFIGIDEEGGRVERTENLFGGKKFLSARYQAQKGVDFVRAQSCEIAFLLKSLGINMNFAPVLDVDTNPDNPIIAERSYADNPKDVAMYATAAMKEYKKNGIIPVGKHFPGHGDVNADSHLTLPVLELPFKEVENVHIRPFKEAIDAGLPSVMAAHLYCPCFDKEVVPSSLSKNVLRYLREKLNFKGLIVSDDMQMGAIGGLEPEEAVLRGIEAGINLFLFRDSSDRTINIIENTVKAVQKSSALQTRVENSFEIIQKLKREFNLL